jgi:spermidine synthase
VAERRLVLFLGLVSGLIGLGYQVIWFRLFSDRFGSGNLTFAFVLVAFVGGLGLGSLASRPLLGWLTRLRPLRDPLIVVGAIEVMIAGGALLVLLVDPSRFLSNSPFPYFQDARGYYEPELALDLLVVVGAACLLVPTFLMGTTFPILCSAFADEPLFPSAFYAWNTLGACLGTLAAMFLLLFYLGHYVSCALLVGLNVALGCAFLLLGRHRDRRDSASAAVAAPRPAAAHPPGPLVPTVLLGAAALSGLLSGALEVDMFRCVRFSGSMSDASMAFTSFWAVAAIFMASATVRALGRPRPRIIAFAFAAAFALHLLSWLALHSVRGAFNDLYLNHVRSQPLPPGLDPASITIYPFASSLWLLFGYTGVLVVPAYYCISLTLPTVCNLLQGDRRHLGIVYGVNTLMFCAGAIAFAFVFPRVSLFYAVKLLFAVLAAGAALAFTFRRQQPLSLPATGLATVAVAIAAVFIPGGFDAAFFPASEAPSHCPVRALKSNGAHTTYVVTDSTGDVLYFDSHQMSGTHVDSQRYMRLMAHVPLLAQAEPHNALLICFGVGNTASAIASHDTIRRLDVVDLNDKVFETAGEFAAANRMVHEDPRVRLIHDDGRRYLTCVREQYDLVTSEPPPPRHEGVYRLYSEEYYRAVLEHLSPAGMMTQWLPIYELSKNGAAMITATFSAVFPHVLVFVGSGQNLILVGSRQPFDAKLLERRFAAAHGPALDLARIDVNDPLAILARIVRVDEGLRREVVGVPLISDAHNDMALQVSDPLDPPRVAVDPMGVLTALDPDHLACGPRLVKAMWDRRLRQAIVPDYP